MPFLLFCLVLWRIINIRDAGGQDLPARNKLKDEVEVAFTQSFPYTALQSSLAGFLVDPEIS